MNTKNMIMIVLLVATMPVMGLAMAQRHPANQVQKQHDVYYCPMHPGVFSDHPGTCPICGMALVKKD